MALATEVSDTICEDCFKSPPPYLSSFSPFLYHFPIDRLIATMKYQKQPHLSKVLAKLAIDERDKQNTPAIQLPEALIPIPMHPRKQRQRGYNQAIYLAKHFGKQYQLPVLTNLLQKTVPTDAQNTLSAAQRRLNLRNALRVNPNILTRPFPYKHVALVDDVITTGATIEEASASLQQIGIEHIDIWTIARTP